jgi:hypothetical protein
MNIESGDLERNSPIRNPDTSILDRSLEPSQNRRMSDPGSSAIAVDPEKLGIKKELRTAQSKINQKSNIEKDVDNFWNRNIEGKELSTK